MSMLTHEEENESQVRREDQDRINRFARLNARRHEIKAEREEVKVSTYSSSLLIEENVCILDEALAEEASNLT